MLTLQHLSYLLGLWDGPFHMLLFSAAYEFVAEYLPPAAAEVNAAELAAQSAAVFLISSLYHT